MSGFSSSAHTQASTEAVWNVLTDWKRGLKWRPGTEAVDVAGAGVGTVLSWTSRGSARTACVEEWSPPQHLAVHYIQGPVEADYVWTLQPEAGGTRVTLTVTTHAQGATRLMLPVFTEMMRRSDEALPAALCAEVER